MSKYINNRYSYPTMANIIFKQLILLSLLTRFADIFTNTYTPQLMNIGERIRKVREAKDRSQKEIALALGMDQSQYSKIELGKNDPTTTTLEKIAQALGVDVADFFQSQSFQIESYDKSVVEKLRLLEELEDAEKKSIFQLIDALSAKKRLMNNLTAIISQSA